MFAPFRVAARGILAGALVAVVVPSSAHAASDPQLVRWSSDAQFNTGTRANVVASGGSIRLAGALPTQAWDDPYTPGGAVAYQYGSWLSPWVGSSFGLNTLVPSWNASTPTGTWVRVEMRVRRGSTIGSFDTLAQWSNASTVKRSSWTSQDDDLARVDVDTLRSRGGAFNAWQVKVVLLRKKGSTATPIVRSVSGIGASYATKTLPRTSATTMTAGKTLNVPKYSQMIHRGEFPRYGGGGQAWCSPTTTSMLLRYQGIGPSPTAYAFANRYREPWVDHAAVNSYDHRYGGTGNWSFTMAYAGNFADAYVTRLGSLKEAESFIRAGVPLGAAIAFASGKLSGAPINSTQGHILAIVGFTKSGDVIVNDPAAANSSSVRRTYQRGQFERAWLGGSGGITYIVRR